MYAKVEGKREFDLKAKAVELMELRAKAGKAKQEIEMWMKQEFNLESVTVYSERNFKLKTKRFVVDFYTYKSLSSAIEGIQTNGCNIDSSMSRDEVLKEFDESQKEKENMVKAVTSMMNLLPEEEESGLIE